VYHHPIPISLSTTPCCCSRNSVAFFCCLMQFFFLFLCFKRIHISSTTTRNIQRLHHSHLPRLPIFLLSRSSRILQIKIQPIKYIASLKILAYLTLHSTYLSFSSPFPPSVPSSTVIHPVLIGICRKIRSPCLVFVQNWVVCFCY
jgi:hypothetical protein